MNQNTSSAVMQQRLGSEGLKIKSNNSPHARPHFRRGHYRDQVTSHLRVEA